LAVLPFILVAAAPAPTLTGDSPLWVLSNFVLTTGIIHVSELGQSFSTSAKKL
jgi:hypothetical protein